ncbi:gastrula zinc finger protein XlCGF26.1 [Eurytemora carolleeae]|uniref:gastrula zinc finger protein XlCGF26.1 n=1 Tax=Eurytemora carolleeae TaxID=1294199 RepID=UPI000C78A442|nr:gastrula zinc finger protein XlCGF26.1 [Eurytemora carolleeae]|eukprot:XP_023335502.1 gastrula zinc finger protein XlCGF26.1-like [Eurytemora affinis]
MANFKLGGLSLRIWINELDDAVVIFADPWFNQFSDMVKYPDIVKIVSSLICENNELEFNNRDFKKRNEKKAEKSIIITQDLKRDVDLIREETIEDEFIKKLQKSADTLKEAEFKESTEEDLEIKFDEEEEEDIKIKVEEDMSTLDDLQADISFQTEEKDPPIEKISTGEFSCKICNKVLSSNSNALKHIKIHGLFIEPVSARTCSNCDKVFKYATLCKLHMKRTCNYKNHKCDICELDFTTLKLLKEHTVRSHNLVCSSEEIPSLKCNECETDFISKKDLVQHVESVHSGTKYSCDICNASLSNERNLKRHIKYVHEVLVRNYACDICGKAFKDNRALRNHFKIHNTENILLPCIDCGKMFSNKNGLKAHIRSLHERDNKHVCEECGKGFINLCSLRTHGEMVHMKGSVHVCQECGVEVLGKNRLRNHIQRNHLLDQKFLACKYCQKEFPKKKLRAHVVKEHKI